MCTYKYMYLCVCVYIHMSLYAHMGTSCEMYNSDMTQLSYPTCSPTKPTYLRTYSNIQTYKFHITTNTYKNFKHPQPYVYNPTLPYTTNIPTNLHATTHYRPHGHAAIIFCNTIACVVCQNYWPPVEGRSVLPPRKPATLQDRQNNKVFV